MTRAAIARVRTACQKPNCTTGSGRLHRHHRGCQHMFVNHFSARKGQLRYEEFRARYYEYHPDDCVTICDSHHEEIHQLYLPIIDRHRSRLRTPMCMWTWNQAEILMRDLSAACDRWLQEETPGLEWTR